MPVVSFPVTRLNQLLGRSYDQDELVEALEQLGCDVEDTAEIVVYQCPSCSTPAEKLPHEDAPRRCSVCGSESPTAFPEVMRDQVIRLDLLAARPDLLDTGGLARSLLGFFGHQTGCPRYETEASDWAIHVDPAMNEPESYRPFIVAAVAVMPPLDGQGLREIMKLQENLHWGIGRDRKLTSIGFYDMDDLRPPIRYGPQDPDRFSFAPLGMPDRNMSLRTILESHPKGVAYAHLLAQHHRYPILQDAAGTVLSMPPIINGESCRVKLGSSRLFIDVTGVVHDPVVNTLNTLTSSLMELGAKIHTVEIHDAWGRSLYTPDLRPRKVSIDIDAARAWLGIPFTPDTLKQTLGKMRFDVLGEGPSFELTYPAFRTDIKHEVDVFEDLAIGHGYANVEPGLVQTMTIADERPEETLTQKMRAAMIGLSFSEIMSLILCSEARQFSQFQIESGDDHVVIANAKTRDQGTARSHLLLGLMETLRVNRRNPPPLRIFETGNIMRLDPEAETGVVEERRLAFAIMAPEAGYADARTVFDSLLRELRWSAEYRPADTPSFLPGRHAEVWREGRNIGRLGEMHPEVLERFGLPMMVATGELTLMRVV